MPIGLANYQHWDEGGNKFLKLEKNEFEYVSRLHAPGLEFWNNEPTAFHWMHRRVEPNPNYVRMEFERDCWNNPRKTSADVCTNILASTLYRRKNNIHCNIFR